jgi:hypothetical protein
MKTWPRISTTWSRHLEQFYQCNPTWVDKLVEEMQIGHLKAFSEAIRAGQEKNAQHYRDLEEAFRRAELIAAELRETLVAK